MIPYRFCCWCGHELNDNRLCPNWKCETYQPTPQVISDFTKHRGILSTKNIREKISNIECMNYDMGEKINEIIHIINEQNKQPTGGTIK